MPNIVQIKKTFKPKNPEKYLINCILKLDLLLIKLQLQIYKKYQHKKDYRFQIKKITQLKQISQEIYISQLF